MWIQRELVLAEARVTLNGSGIRSPWIAEGFSRMKPQTSAFYFIYFLQSCWVFLRRDSSSSTRKAFKEASGGSSWRNELLTLVSKSVGNCHRCGSDTGAGAGTEFWEYISSPSTVYRVEWRLQRTCGALGCLSRGVSPSSPGYMGSKLLWLVIQFIYLHCGWQIFEHTYRNV